MKEKSHNVRIEFALDVGYEIHDDHWSYVFPDSLFPKGGMEFQSPLHCDIGTELTINLFGFSQNTTIVRECVAEGEDYKVTAEFVQIHPDAQLVLEQMQRLEWMFSSSE